LQRLKVDHKTVYRYSRSVTFGEHRLMVRPRDSHDLRLIKASLITKPEASLRWIHDVFGNSVAVAEFSDMSDHLSIESSIVIDRYPALPGSFRIEPFAQTLPFSYPASEVPDLGRTIERHYPDPLRRVTEWTRRFLHTGIGATDTDDFLLKVTAAIKDEFEYEIRKDEGTQTPTQTLERGKGSCRDFALFMMEAARSVGLAARFISGYLYDPALDGEHSKVVGAGSTHAWVEIYLPGAGWVEFDPTNGSYGGHNLVRVAVAREPRQATPISGIYHGAGNETVELAVDVSVHREDLHEGAA
jgi:transglutaminase-like putative cysteine protease